MKLPAKILCIWSLMLSVSSTTFGQETYSGNTNETIPEGCRMKFGKDGQFKILQLTDLHYMFGNDKTTRSITAVEKLIAYENPDLIIVTGDVIDPPVELSLHGILAPLEASGIPYSLVYGNHDGGVAKRDSMANVAREMPHCVNRFFNDNPGGSTGVITLSNRAGDKVLRAIYLLDSNGASTNKSIGNFDHVRAEGIEWYRSMSDMLADGNGGNPVPALMFYHIPITELKTAVSEGEICGTRTWNEVTPTFSNGLFLAAKEQGDVDGMFFGHDHGNDYSVLWHDILLAYGRYTGCKERIGGLAPQGARVIVLDENTNKFSTYIRLMDGTTEQDEK